MRFLLGVGLFLIGLSLAVGSGDDGRVYAQESGKVPTTEVAGDAAINKAGGKVVQKSDGGAATFLWRSLTKAFTDPHTTVISSTVVSLMFLLLVIFVVLLVEAKSVLVRLEKSVEDLKAFSARNQSVIRSEVESKITKLIPTDLPMFATQWPEFIEGLLDYAPADSDDEDDDIHDDYNAEEPGTYGAGPEPTCHNSLSADAFFKSENFLTSIRRSWFPYSFLEIVPTLLTTLGMLGTFLGVAVGLGQIDLDNTSNLILSTRGVVHGLSAAFWTSIIGLFLAVVVHVVTNVTDARLIRSF